MNLVLLPPVRTLCTRIEILYTTPEETRAALTTAASLGNDLGLPIRVLAFQVAPYPLNVDEPAVACDFLVERILSELTPAATGQLTIEFVLCRDLTTALVRTLEPASIIMIGGRSGFTAFRRRRMAGKLARLGHQVVFASAGTDTKST